MKNYFPNSDWQRKSDQVKTLTAHFIDGFPVKDIAQQDQVPIGTVLSRIHSGKQLLRDAWDASSRGPAKRGSSEPEWGR